MFRMRLTIGRPGFHQRSALSQGVATPVSLLSLIADDMRQRRFGDLAGGLISGPISER